jgi:hypothetical protein
MSRKPVRNEPEFTSPVLKEQEELAQSMTTTPSSRSGTDKGSNKSNKGKKTRRPIKPKDQVKKRSVDKSQDSNSKPQWEHTSQEDERDSSRNSSGSPSFSQTDPNLRRRDLAEDDAPPVNPSRAIVPKEDQVIAEQYVDSIASALQNVGYTDQALKILDGALEQGVEINVGAIVDELQNLVTSPVQGVLEANRIGAVSSMYAAHAEVLESLLEDLRSEDLLPGQKIKLMDNLALRIRTMSMEIGPAAQAGRPAGLKDGEFEISQTRKVKVNLKTAQGRRKADRVLGEQDRPDDSFGADDFLD